MEKSYMSEDYQVILISHNKLAQGVLMASKMIAGGEVNARAYALMPGENPDQKVEEIAKTIDENTHTVILADLFGGSMANAATALSVKPNIRLITGLNLALALQVILEKPWTDSEIDKVIENAKSNIRRVKIEPDTDDDDDEFF